ncbi:hypothetical protein ABC502_18595, partial [Alkalimonas sp. NCh-2]|uniref:hypothetical protein n=1 Tax=Alkalimonas sp. NCh-2 TaxID=3144846 RepID=UPI0031F6E74F
LPVYQHRQRLAFQVNVFFSDRSIGGYFRHQQVVLIVEVITALAIRYFFSALPKWWTTGLVF